MTTRPDIPDPFNPVVSPGETLPEVAASQEELRGRLPGLYFRNSGGFLALARAVAETMSRISEEFARWTGLERQNFPAGAGVSPGNLDGTAAGLLRFLSTGIQSRRGALPAVWQGVAVRRAGHPGELELVRSDLPSAVLAWPAGADLAICDPARIPPDLVPPCVCLQVVRLGGPAPNSSISGERFPGEILGRGGYGD